MSDSPDANPTESPPDSADVMGGPDCNVDETDVMGGLDSNVDETDVMGGPDDKG